MTWIDDVRQLPDELDDGHNGHIDAHRTIHAALRNWQPEMRGHGQPEGKTAAPVGTIYTDLDATAGAIRWIKASGTGKTGWRVEYGDTGWRNLTSQVSGVISGGLYLRRVSETVFVDFSELKTEDQNTAFNSYPAILPAGFRMSRITSYFAFGARTSDYAEGPVGISPSGAIYLYSPAPQKIYTGQAVFSTSQGWPATLPGAPA